METPRPLPIDPELLLSHDAFVRRLASALLSGRGGAEDLAQQVWVAALTRGPGDPATLRGWLATVVRRLAAKVRVREARRHAREATVAIATSDLGGAAVSDQAYFAREQLRRRVVDALFALDEPYRTTMLLRYLDDLPPRAVAERMGVPVETVRTRVKRALTQLRERLRTELGPDESWCGALAALATGATVMAGPAKLAVAAATVGMALVAWLGWEAWSSRESRAITTTLVDRSAPAIADASTPPIATRTPAVADATAPSPPAAIGPPPPSDLDLDGPTGSLIVTTVDDAGRPIPDVWLVVTTRRSGAPFGEEPEGLTDEHGERRFEEIAAGPVQVATGLGTSGRATVVPGDATHLRLRIDGAAAWSIDLAGKVVDEHDAPVADAAIWLNRYDQPLRARNVATSDAVGCFEVEGVPRGRCTGVFAAAEGYVDSLLVQPDGASRSSGPLPVRLVLRRGAGSLAGLVVDANGEPLPGSSVVVGSDRAFFVPESIGAEGPATRVARVATSDETGRFDLTGVAPGTWPLVVRRRGFATHVGTVIVEVGKATDVFVTLERGALLEGRLLDVDGTPCVGAEVQFGSPWFFRSSRTLTREDGTFVLGGLPAGKMTVRAIDRTRGRVCATLELFAGERTAWEARLPAGAAIRGRVRDAKGDGVARLDVKLRGQCDAELDPIDPSIFQSTTTEEDGRFAFERLPAGNYELDFTNKERSFPELARRDLAPGGESLELLLAGPTVADAFLVGSVEDADGTPIREAKFLLRSSRADSFLEATLDADSGLLHAGPLVAGSYLVTVSVAGHPEFRLPEVTLAAGAEHDLGVIVLPRLSTLTVRCLDAEGVARDGIRTRLACPDGYMREAVVKDGIATFNGVVAGRHDLQIGGAGVTLQCVPIDILDGRDARQDVLLLSGVEVVLRFVLPPLPRDPGWLPTATLVVEGSTVELASTLLPDLGGTPFDWRVTLAPGRYTLLGSLAHGQQPQQQPVIVTPNDPPGRVVEFRFR